MRKIRIAAQTIGAVAIVVLSFLGTIWLMDRYWGPSCPAGQQITEFKRPFAKVQGVSWYKDGVTIVGGPNNPSKLVLCEDGVVIGPANAPHADIAKDGKGRFSHWGNTLIFSASDNSDPNKNGKAYTLVQP